MMMVLRRKTTPMAVLGAPWQIGQLHGLFLLVLNDGWWWDGWACICMVARCVSYFRMRHPAAAVVVDNSWAGWRCSSQPQSLRIPPVTLRFNGMGAGCAACGLSLCLRRLTLDALHQRLRMHEP